MNLQEKEWENIEKCKCGKNSVCKLIQKDGIDIYFCWDCFFKYGDEK